jgi:hypothetical protein
MAWVEKALRRLVDEEMRLRFKAEERVDKALRDLDMAVLVRMPGEYGKRFAMTVAEGTLKAVGDQAIEAGRRFGKEIRRSVIRQT